MISIKRSILITGAAVFCFVSPLVGQTHYSIGLFNAGKIAQEKTHHVRMGAMGRDVYFGLGVERKVFGKTSGVVKFTYMPTNLAVWHCKNDPCEDLNRLDHRPDSTVHSYNMSWTTVGLGLRENVGPIHISGGGSFNIIHAANYQFWGASPMLTVGGWTEAHLEYKGIGLEIGASIIPPQKARYTVLDDAGGGKESGQPYSEKLKTIHAIYAGVTVQTH